MSVVYHGPDCKILRCDSFDLACYTATYGLGLEETCPCPDDVGCAHEASCIPEGATLNSDCCHKEIDSVRLCEDTECH